MFPSVKQFIHSHNLPWFPYLVWTVWFLLDPVLNRGYNWDAIPLTSWCWVLGLIILTQLSMIFHHHGGISSVVFSVILLFFFLWGAEDWLAGLTGHVLFANPYDLVTLWQGGSIYAYGHFVTWLQAWVLCLGAVILWVRAWGKKKLKP